jgi:hypothetical protein
MSININSILQEIKDNLISINHFIDEEKNINRFEIQLGILPDWTYVIENSIIDVIVLGESVKGKIIKIVPKNDTVIIDDLIAYAKAIIMTNKEKEKKEIELKEKLENMKLMFESELKNFQEEIKNSQKDIFNSLLTSSTKDNDIESSKEPTTVVNKKKTNLTDKNESSDEKKEIN